MSHLRILWAKITTKKSENLGNPKVPSKKRISKILFRIFIIIAAHANCVMRRWLKIWTVGQFLMFNHMTIKSFQKSKSFTLSQNKVWNAPICPLNFFTRRISILYHLIFRKWLFEYFDPVTVTAAYNTLIRDYFGFTVFIRNSIELLRNQVYQLRNATKKNSFD